MKSMVDYLLDVHQDVTLIKVTLIHELNIP